MNLQISSTITKKDFYRVGPWLTVYQNKSTSFLSTVMVFVLLILIDLITLFSDEPDLTQVIIFTIAIVLYPFVILLSTRVMLNYTYDLDMNYPKQMHYTFLDDAIQVDYEEKTFDYPYALVTVVKEFKGVLSLYLDKKLPIIIHEADTTVQTYQSLKAFLATKLSPEYLKWRNNR